jgi:hypothetical protein
MHVEWDASGKEYSLAGGAPGPLQIIMTRSNVAGQRHHVVKSAALSY